MAPPDTFQVSPRALAGSGISLDRLCERAGVAPATHWGTDDFFKLWTAADRDIDDRAAGLRFGVDDVASGYSVAAAVALHAPDFGHALAAISRYKRLTPAPSARGKRPHHPTTASATSRITHD